MSRLPDRTSASHPLQFVSLPLHSGSVMLSEAPGLCNRIVGGGYGHQHVHRDLRADLERMRDAGISALVTLMMPDEIVDADMTELAGTCTELGIAWFHLGLDSDARPNQFVARELAKLLPVLRKLLDEGRNIALHSDSWDARLELGVLWIARSIEPAASAMMLRIQIEAAVRSGMEKARAFDAIE